MTREQAKEIAIKMRTKGRTCPQIAATLKRHGYRGRRGPLTPAGVNLMLLKAGQRKRAKYKLAASTQVPMVRRVEPTVAATKLKDDLPKRDRIEVVRDVLRHQALTLQERVDLALWVVS